MRKVLVELEKINDTLEDTKDEMCLSISNVSDVLDSLRGYVTYNSISDLYDKLENINFRISILD